MSETQAKPLWMSGTPADDDPMVLAVSKRIRAFRKKVDKIEKIEVSASQDGKLLTDEQKQLLASKVSVVSILQELEKLRETQIRIVMKSIKHQTCEIEREETRDDLDSGDNTGVIEYNNSPMEVEPQESASRTSNFESRMQETPPFFRDLLSLFFVARLLDSKLQPHIGGFRDSMKDNDRLALQYLTVLVEGSGRVLLLESNLTQRIEECEFHAKKYVMGSQDEFMPGFSYLYIHNLVDEFISSTPSRPSANISFMVPSFVSDGGS